ncbi:MAG: hypothetical protein ABIQ95_09990 [Bdellovibrionia bacterium]
MNVCKILETNPIIVDLAAGFFWGFGALATLLAVLIPALAVSGVPSRLLLDLFYYYLINLVFRILILGLSLLIPAFLTYIIIQDVSSLVRAVSCSPALTPSVEIQAGLILSLLLLLEYWISFLYLDSRFGLDIKEIRKTLGDGTPNTNHPIELLRAAQKQGLLDPGIPEYLLKDIKFGLGKNIKNCNAVTYGGLLFRPRLILPPNFQTLFPEELLIPILLHEIALIRRRDSLFFGIFTALSVLFRTQLNLGRKQISCDTYALNTFVPEIVVHTLCAMLGDIRPVPKDYHAFHKQTFELIQAHSVGKSNRAIRARIIWAAQFCNGGGYFKEATAIIWKLRSKTPRILIGVICILGLSLPFCLEIRESFLYHPVFQQKYALPGASPKQEKIQDAFSN